MSDERPEHRRLHLTLSLDADDLDELDRALSQINLDLLIERERLERVMREQTADVGRIVDVTSGGVDSGHSLRLEFRPGMTGERYRDELRAWWDRRARL